MSVTYERDPRIGNVQKVRFHLGDVEEGRYLVEDEEILYALERASNAILLAAAICAESLAARFARSDFIRTGPTHIRKSQLQKHYYELANRLRQQATTADAFVSLTVDDATAESLKSDTSVSQPQFSMGMHNNTQ